MTDSAVYAAGGVVWRFVDGRLHVLLIHRTKYRDVTLPKGKVDPGEALAETAVREIHEETGIRVRLGVPVGVSRYRMPSKRQKVVHYWAAEATEKAIRASTFVPNKEIAALQWVPAKKVLEQLSYPVDVEIMESFFSVVNANALRTFPLIVLRHAKALPREEWDGPEAERPLHARGHEQAKAIVGALAAFGPKRLISSPATRCVQSVQPLAEALGRTVRDAPLISQDAWDEDAADPRTVVGKRVRARKAAVLVSHRPLLPKILEEIALATGTVKGSYLSSAATLDPAAFSVVHLSKDNPGSGIITIETHLPRT